MTGVLVFLATALAVWTPALLSIVFNTRGASGTTLLAYVVVFVALLYSPASRRAWKGFAERLTLNNYS